MSWDSHANLVKAVVATAPSPATSGVTLNVQSGQGALFPAPPFNVTIWPAAADASHSNSEIARVTNIVTDAVTLVRAQEGSSARAIVVGDQIALTITSKSLQDIESNADSLQTQITNLGGGLVNGTQDQGILYWSAGSTDWINDLLQIANVNPASTLLGKAITMGLGGTVAATITDGADFLSVVPFNMTLQTLYCSAKTAPTGAMAVTLRRSTNNGSTFSNVTGFVATFTSGVKYAVATPTPVNVGAGDLLNFSVATGSGLNLLVTAAGICR